MSYQVTVCMTDNLTGLITRLKADGLRLSQMRVSTKQVIDGEESILMIKDRGYRLQRVLKPLIDDGLMSCLGAKQLLGLADEEGNLIGTIEAVYIQNPRQPWLDMSEAELETVKRLTGYHLTTNEEGEVVPSHRNWFGDFVWPL